MNIIRTVRWDTAHHGNIYAESYRNHKREKASGYIGSNPHSSPLSGAKTTPFTSTIRNMARCFSSQTAVFLGTGGYWILTAGQFPATATNSPCNSAVPIPGIRITDIASPADVGLCPCSDDGRYAPRATFSKSSRYRPVLCPAAACPCSFFRQRSIALTTQSISCVWKHSGGRIFSTLP